MPQGNEHVEFFGYGPHESYVDKHRSTYKGRFETTVSNMHEDYCILRKMAATIRQNGHVLQTHLAWDFYLLAWMIFHSMHHITRLKT